MQTTLLNGTRAKREVKPLNEDMNHKASKVSIEPIHSMDYVAAWVNSGLSQLSGEFEKVKDDSKKTFSNASTTILKNLGNGLSLYNAKAADVVNKLPGGVGVKAGEYPWVSISFALIVGFFLCGFLRARRN